MPIGGKSYQVKLTLALADKVQEATAADLLAEDVSNVLCDLLFDQRKLGRVLWAFCESQATGEGVTRDAFFEALDGDTLANGHAAVVDAVGFFIPSHRRKAFELAIEKQMEAIAAGAAVIERTIASQQTAEGVEKVVAEMGEQMQAEMSKAFDKPASS